MPPKTTTPATDLANKTEVIHNRFTMQNMTLKHLKAVGLQGQTINQPIGQGNLITGDNGAGKTAITNALTLGFLGYLPRLGKKNAATMELATGDLLEVELQVDADRIRRQWTRKGTTVSSQHALGTLEELPDYLVPTVFDFGVLLQAKATERQRILESVMQPSDPIEIQQQLGEALMDQPAEVGEDYPTDLQSWKAIEEQAADLGRASKQELDRLQKAAQQVEVDDADQEPTDYDAAAHATKKAAVDQLSQQVGTTQAQADQISDARMHAPERPDEERPTADQLQAAADLVAKEQKARQDVTRLEQANRKIDQACQELNRQKAEVERKGVTEVEPDDARPTAQQLDDATKAERAADEVLKRAQNQIELRNRQIAALQAERDQQLATLDGCEECPTCKRPVGERMLGEGVNTLGDLVALGFQAKLTDLQGLLVDDHRAAKEAEEQHRIALEADETLQALRDDWADYDRHFELQTLQKEIDDLMADYVTEMPGDQYDEASEQQRQLMQIEQAWAIYTAAEVPTAEAEQEAVAAHRAAVESFKAAKLELQQLDDLQARRHEQLTRKRQREKLASEIKDAEIAVKAHQELRDWAKGKSLKDAAARLAGLLEPANAVLDGVVDGKLAVDGVIIGLEIDGKMRPLEVLSGAELAAVAAAVQVALASTGPIKLVIVDELSRFTPERRRKLLHNLSGLVDWQTIDAWVATDHDQAFVDDFEAAGLGIDLQVIRVEGGAA